MAGARKGWIDNLRILLWPAAFVLSVLLAAVLRRLPLARRVL
jgi:hypothetical protein